MRTKMITFAEAARYKENIIVIPHQSSVKPDGKVTDEDGAAKIRDRKMAKQ